MGAEARRRAMRRRRFRTATVMASATTRPARIHSRENSRAADMASLTAWGVDYSGAKRREWRTGTQVEPTRRREAGNAHVESLTYSEAYGSTGACGPMRD